LSNDENMEIAQIVSLVVYGNDCSINYQSHGTDIEEAQKTISQWEEEEKEVYKREFGASPNQYYLIRIHKDYSVSIFPK
jgi:hypothetical protein